MGSSRVSNWLQIIGNVGLIIGLVLVAVQIKQNNDLGKAQLLSDGWLGALQSDTAQIGENLAASIARAIANPEQLTAEDLIVLDHIVGPHTTSGSRLINLDEAGYGWFPPEAFASAFVESNVDSPFGMAWWNENRNISFGGGVVADLVDHRVAQLGTEAGRGQLDRYARIRAYIAEHWSPAA